MIKKIVTVGAIILLGACAEMQTTEQPVKEKATTTKTKAVVTKAISTAAADATAAIGAAEKARKAADKVGYEWRDTAKLIKQARAAAKKKNYTQAIKLANEAKKQGDNALAQYHDQKNAGSIN